MVVAAGSVHCGRNRTSAFFCQVRCKFLQGQVWHSQGKNSVVFRGMSTTWNVSKLVHLRQFKLCMDLSLNSSEHGTGARNKMGGGEFLLSRACYKLILNSALSTMPSCIFDPCFFCVCTDSVVAFLLTFAAAVNIRYGMEAFPSSLTFLHPHLSGGIILPVWQRKC